MIRFCYSNLTNQRTNQYGALFMLDLLSTIIHPKSLEVAMFERNSFSRISTLTLIVLLITRYSTIKRKHQSKSKMATMETLTSKIRGDRREKILT